MSQDPTNQAGMLSDVFISYASHDAAVANSIVENLEQQGVKCWLAPRDVKPGAQYADAIVRAINEAKALVLVMSASAVDSAHVAREVERAASKRKQIIPFRIDAAALNPELEYFLSNSQWIDVPASGMPAAMAKLKEAVGQATPASGPVTLSALSTKPKASETVRRTAVTAAVLAIVGVAVALGVRYLPSTREGMQTPSAPNAVISDKSIAVLPFIDLSEKHDQEYFADGMAEEILNLLARVPGLKVIGRTSSFQFKGRANDLRAVGTALGAIYVLEGSVRRSGDHLRVTAQLIDTRTGAHRWSEEYDRDARDAIAVQDEIAASLVRALEVEVVSLPARIRPKSSEAYDDYMRGLHAQDRFDEQGFSEARANFQRALDSDPSFAPAAEQLAKTLYYIADWGFVPAKKAYGEARSAAMEALRLDPNSVLAHVQLGAVHTEYDWDWSAAERELEIARKLSPNDADALVTLAQQRLAIGQWSGAAQLIDAAISGDPLDASLYSIRLQTYERLGRLTDAENAGRRILEISPTFAWGHYQLGTVLLMEGEREAALAEMQKETVLQGRDTGLAIVYQALHQTKDAEAALARLQMDSQWPTGLAYAYAAFGENKAFQWFDQAYANRDSDLYHIKGHPFLKRLETDPRYKAFLKKMNLPE